MAERARQSAWSIAALYILTALVLLFINLIPLQTAPVGWVGPDVLLVLTLALVVRRPDAMPLWVIVGVTFFADLVLGRPPGLWTVLVLIGTEGLRKRHDDLIESAYVFEVLYVTLAMILVYVGYIAALSLLGPDPVNGKLLLQQLVLSVLLYPVLSGALYLLSGVRKSAPGETDDRGRPV
ncbi:MAG: rod shape-determining protein MreD [Shimia sp.]